MGRYTKNISMGLEYSIYATRALPSLPRPLLMKAFLMISYYDYHIPRKEKTHRTSMSRGRGGVKKKVRRGNKALAVPGTQVPYNSSLISCKSPIFSRSPRRKDRTSASKEWWEGVARWGI